MTTVISSLQAFADAMAGIVEDHDAGDVLRELLENCAVLYPAAAVAVLVRDGRPGLELLSATSHRAEELELLQMQHEQGPCVEAISSGAPVFASSAGEMVQRWGPIGEAVAARGFTGVHAYPMHWRTQVIGGLNIFLSNGAVPAPESRTIGRMAADLATLVVVHTSDAPTGQITARVHEAVTARSVVEQAKGVLAYQHDVGMAAAFDLLVRRAAERGVPVSELARTIVEETHRGSSKP
jgi:hypothetical protein